MMPRNGVDMKKTTPPRKHQELRVNGKIFICVICGCGMYHMIDRDIRGARPCKCGAKLSLER
jgi:hypothetical protein